MEQTAIRARRRWWIVGALSLAILAGAGLAGVRWRWAREQIARVFIRAQPLRPAALTIVPGIHLLGGLAPSAAYAVETSEGLVLVDSGLDRDAARLKQELSALGLDWKRVRAVFLTHVHGDHSGGAEYLRAATGAKVYAGRGDAAVLRDGGPREAFFSTFHMPDHAPHPTTVDVALDGDEVIVIGDMRIHAVATPGHTPGSVCYLVERQGLRAFFAGDVIMMLQGDRNPSSELRKPLGTYSAYLEPRFRGDARAYLASLRRLRALPVPDLVLPGHPRADPTPQSPVLSQQRWNALLDGGIRDMETLAARYETDGQDFLDGRPKVLLPDLYDLGTFQGRGAYGFATGEHYVVIGSPSGPGWIDFLAAGRRQLKLPPRDPTAVLLTSCGAAETAGLAELIERCRPIVIAPDAGLEPLRQSCPPAARLAGTEALRQLHGFDATPLPLRGRGVAPTAYIVRWAGKTVLASGPIPIKPHHDAAVVLIADLAQPPARARQNVGDYLASLGQLRAQRPDVWLPETPVDAQNANLYGGEWQENIAENLSIIRNNIAQIVGRSR